MPTAARAGVYESGSVRVHPTGKVEVFTGSHSHGQGHETTFAQVVADRLGVPLEDAKIRHGDTEEIPYGMGTYGSRSISVGGSAIVKAVDKITSIAQEAASYGRGGMRAKRKRSICICIYIMLYLHLPSCRATASPAWRDKTPCASGPGEPLTSRLPRLGYAKRPTTLVSPSVEG